MCSSFPFRFSGCQFIILTLVTLAVFQESVLAAKEKERSKPGTLLQTQLDDIYRKLGKDDAEMTNLTERLAAVQKTLKEIQIAENHEAMEKSIKHFENVNQIWKNNFRSIRSSFGQIREKLGITKPNISLEREGQQQ